MVIRILLLIVRVFVFVLRTSRIRLRLLFTIRVRRTRFRNLRHLVLVRRVILRVLLNLSRFILLLIVLFFRRIMVITTLLRRRLTRQFSRRRLTRRPFRMLFASRAGILIMRRRPMMRLRRPVRKLRSMMSPIGRLLLLITLMFLLIVPLSGLLVRVVQKKFRLMFRRRFMLTRRCRRTFIILLSRRGRRKSRKFRSLGTPGMNTLVVRVQKWIIILSRVSMSRLRRSIVDNWSPKAENYPG